MAIDDDGTYTATERRGATAESLRRSCRERSPRHITKLVGRSLSLVHRGVRSRHPRSAGDKVVFDIGE